jgi:DNA-directed RNA polymerase specialized sigma24 family protein
VKVTDLCGRNHCITPEILLDGALFEHAQRCAPCWDRFIASLDERAAGLPEIPGLMTAFTDLLAMTEDDDVIACFDEMPVSLPYALHADAESEICRLLGKFSDFDTEWSDSLRDLAVDVAVSMFAESSLARRGLHLAHGNGASLLTADLGVEAPAIVSVLEASSETLPAAGEIRWIARPVGRFKATQPETPEPDAYEVPPIFFDEEFWARAIPRLSVYAQRRLSAMRAERIDAEDCVQQAVMLVLDRTRRCRGVGPERFLFNVIDSLISHEQEKHGRDVDVVDTAPLCEQSLIAEDLKRHLLMLLPPDLRDYVRLRVSETCLQVEDYAEALDVSIADIRNMERRLQRRRKLWWSGLPKRKRSQEN